MSLHNLKSLHLMVILLFCDESVKLARANLYCEACIALLGQKLKHVQWLKHLDLFLKLQQEEVT